MNFDKTKAMRNAEKYVAQGKIRSAIAEYRAVVGNDPRDIGTLNMLGDLLVKNSEKREAVSCYMLVAEHYAKQGFAQKAIAIYNKISRLQPESIEVSTKLAELYKTKGSLSEARSHYTTLAEHYDRTGHRIEALAMWKQIALLDPNNTSVCISLAQSYLKEGHREEAAEAYAEAATRFMRQGSPDDAIAALMKGQDIRPNDLRILDGLVKAYSAMGHVGKAVDLLENILDDEPYNRDVLYLLIDCHIDSHNAARAEKAVIKLVEMEPANYPKLLDLIRLYLDANDPDSAARILSMSSEYLLAAGQGEECLRWINAILEREPHHIGALRLLVRYCSWIKDESAYSVALVRMLAAANKSGQPEEERYALSHLVVTRPLETEYAKRLQELNEQHGFDPEPVDAELLRAQFRTAEPHKFQEDESAVSVLESQGFHTGADLDPVEPLVKRSERSAETKHIEIEPEVVEVVDHEVILNAEEAESDLAPSDEQRFQKEYESIKFYIENGYDELAAKNLDQMIAEFGERPSLAELRKRLNAPATNGNGAGHSLSLDEIRSEFGLEGSETNDGVTDDYETLYQMAVAYQEMGLMEQAIKGFQDAISLVSPKDGTRRFFYCANLLGYCFLNSGMAHLAVTWYKRALETANLSDDEALGLRYELGIAFEADGDSENASKYFEQVYAENVDFRDVGERVKHLTASR